MDLLNSIISICAEAGQSILKHYDAPIVQTDKPDGSPLTKADVDSHQCLISALAGLTPGIPIISEEGRPVPFDERKNWNEFWLVDPLDGTKEFLKRNGEFTVNVGLIRNHVPELGVIYAPALDIFYFAQTGRGSWKQRGQKSEPDAAPERLFSSPLDPNQPVRVVVSRSHMTEEAENYLKTFRVAERISVGSSLKFCYLAEGKADLYPRFGPTMEWDVAAGDCIFINSGRPSRRHSGLTYNKMDLRNGNFILGLK